MPFGIEGWIEVSQWSAADSNEECWCGVVNLGGLVDVADSDSERLFGLSKACVSGDRIVESVAAGRGIPFNPSTQVQDELAKIAAHDLQFGRGEVGGFTHVNWSDISGYPIGESLESSEWTLSFAIAKQLEKRFSPNQIRFVVWFNW